METRKILAGGMADFLIHLTQLVDPIVIGNDYPRDRLMKAFQSWAKERNFCIDSADISGWRAACRNGDMQ